MIYKLLILQIEKETDGSDNRILGIEIVRITKTSKEVARPVMRGPAAYTPGVGTPMRPPAGHDRPTCPGGKDVMVETLLG